MAIVLRKRGTSRVYWIAFYDQNRKQVWERVGTDKREAEALDRQRKREVKEGTYERGSRPTMPLGEWFKQWIERRDNANAKEEARLMHQFILSRPWLCSIKCEELRNRHST